jgi:hypothetical protein
LPIHQIKTSLVPKEIHFLGIVQPLSVFFWGLASSSLLWCCWHSVSSVGGKDEHDGVVASF